MLNMSNFVYAKSWSVTNVSKKFRIISRNGYEYKTHMSKFNVSQSVEQEEISGGTL